MEDRGTSSWAGGASKGEGTAPGCGGGGELVVCVDDAGTGGVGAYLDDFAVVVEVGAGPADAPGCAGIELTGARPVVFAATAAGL